MSVRRGRLAFAAGAAAVLLVAVVAVAVGGPSSSSDAAAGECLAAWNDDAVARSEGVHAYGTHGYRETLVARVDRDGEILESPDREPSPDERCAVIFAATEVDDEPEFGVRVHDDGRWHGLALVDRVPLAVIETMQREATGAANATLLPDGRLAAD